MKHSSLISMFALSAACGWSCSGNTSLKGTNPAAGPAAPAAGEGLFTPTPGWGPQTVPTAYPTAQSISSAQIMPVQVVDRMEVFRDAATCVARANQLAASAGFSADASRSVNFGYYKIEPSQGLCDIHFVAKLGDPLLDHEGRDSILGNQIALYCPCAGPWAMTGDQYEMRYFNSGAGPTF